MSAGLFKKSGPINAPGIVPVLEWRDPDRREVFLDATKMSDDNYCDECGKQVNLTLGYEQLQEDRSPQGGRTSIAKAHWRISWQTALGDATALVDLARGMTVGFSAWKVIVELVYLRDASALVFQPQLRVSALLGMGAASAKQPQFTLVMTPDVEGGLEGGLVPVLGETTRLPIPNFAQSCDFASSVAAMPVARLLQWEDEQVATPIDNAPIGKLETEAKNIVGGARFFSIQNVGPDPASFRATWFLNIQ
jgi:hypothetical protein